MHDRRKNHPLHHPKKKIYCPRIETDTFNDLSNNDGNNESNLFQAVVGHFNQSTPNKATVTNPPDAEKNSIIINTSEDIFFL